jgi:hypothetical protein
MFSSLAKWLGSGNNTLLVERENAKTLRDINATRHYEHLHCVICTHSWLAIQGEKQTTNTYCKGCCLHGLMFIE